jgi:hypothetical protein
MCIGSTQWWEKLSNSGDILKLLIPSYSRKWISGWTNHSGMVTSQKMSENEMGYRGSKSSIQDLNLEKIDVKEQRVDGSYFGIVYISKLRCTLTGFERSYPIKYHSKQIEKWSYSTSCNANHLNPWFITGFSDAESCFSILVQPNTKSRLKWRVKPIFTIGLHSKDIELLNLIKNTLGVGKVSIRTTSKTVVYSVESLKYLEVIVNHFINFPLVTAKKNDFNIFKKCFKLIQKGEHLTEKVY